MSADATGYVWKHSPYTGARFIIHLAMADVVNDAHDNEFWMSVPRLARKARVSRAAAFEALNHMCGHGHLTRLESGQNDGKPSRYRFNLPVDNSGGGVQDLDGGVHGADQDPSRGWTHNLKKNSNERGGFSTGEARPTIGGRFRGELRPIGSPPACLVCGDTGWVEVDKGTVTECTHQDLTSVKTEG